MLRRIWTHRADLPLAIEITLWLALARLILLILPFDKVAALLQPTVHIAATGVNLPRIGRIVTAVARIVPWRAVCFHHGIAAQRILCRRGIAADLHYGVRRQADGQIKAHVWVTAQGQMVVGGAIAADYTPLTTFAAVDLANTKSR